MFERFTESARRAVVLAQEASRALGHNYIGTEHLFLGLLRSDERIAASRLLAATGLTYNSVAAMLPKGDHRKVRDHIPFTAAAKKTLEKSFTVSVGLGHAHVAPEHLLLGLLATPDELITRVLDQHGRTPDELHSQLLAELQEIPEDKVIFTSAGDTPPWAELILDQLRDLSAKIDEIAHRLDQPEVPPVAEG